MTTTKYNPGDIIFMPMHVRSIEIYGEFILYRVDGNDTDGNDVLIPEDKVVCGIHDNGKEMADLIKNLRGQPEEKGPATFAQDFAEAMRGMMREESSST